MGYFGTDGVRGRAGAAKLAPEVVVRLARAAALATGARRAAVGRDTRASGHALEAAVVAGLSHAGCDAELVGVLPTAGTSWWTAHTGADLGLMITASHNPHTDNGLKLFGADGTKLADSVQAEVGARMEDAPEAPGRWGRVAHMEGARETFADLLLGTVPQDALKGLSVVLDAANGAGSALAPGVLRRAGAEVHAIGVAPDGTNINRGVGSTHPETLAAEVVARGADVGVALDGDADRLILADETGRIIDGDQILALLADAHDAPALVSTVMSNLGLQRHLEEQGKTLHRTAVGDRHVAKLLRETGLPVGGEPSGHLLLPAVLPTGDGTLAALQALAALRGRKASDALRLFTPVPQLLRNVRYTPGDGGASPLERADVRDAIAKAQSDLSGRGRLLVRLSGTEPLVRIMVEGDDMGEVEAVAKTLAEAVAGS